MAINARMAVNAHAHDKMSVSAADSSALRISRLSVFREPVA
jgi:hypothetical protein